MKGLLLGILAVSAWAGAWGVSAGTNLPVPMQQIQQMEQQLLQDWRNLVSLVQSGQADPAQVNQALRSISQQMQQIQSVMDQAEVRQHHLRHLPSVAGQAGAGQTARTAQAGQVEIVAGDARVATSAVRASAQLVQSLSTGVVHQVTGVSLKKAQVVLFSSPQTYGRALEKAGVPAGEIDSIVQNTGGLTVGETVWIPLYNVQNEADLANVLTHELTHAALNQAGIGDSLPTWVNEGTAWLSGMMAEQQVSPQAVARLASASDAQLRHAAANGALLPLTASESDILQASYNVEWEDYRAVQSLVSKYGLAKWTAFLQGIPSRGVAGSFSQVYGISLQTYEQQFVNGLERV